MALLVIAAATLMIAALRTRESIFFALIATTVMMTTTAVWSLTEYPNQPHAHLNQTNRPMNWLIWSIEHNAWWMPNSRGYTKLKEAAGRYSIEEASDIVYGANKHNGDTPNEAMIPED